MVIASFVPRQLVVWREEDHSLTPLSKDHEDCDVFSAEFLVDEPGMGIVVSDGRRNIKVCRLEDNLALNAFTSRRAQYFLDRAIPFHTSQRRA